MVPTQDGDKGPTRRNGNEKKGCGRGEPRAPGQKINTHKRNLRRETGNHSKGADGSAMGRKGKVRPILTRRERGREKRPEEKIQGGLSLPFPFGAYSTREGKSLRRKKRDAGKNHEEKAGRGKYEPIKRWTKGGGSRKKKKQESWGLSEWYLCIIPARKGGGGIARGGEEKNTVTAKRGQSRKRSSRNGEGSKGSKKKSRKDRSGDVAHC